MSDAGKMSILDPIQESSSLSAELLLTEDCQESFFQAVSPAKIIIVKKHDIAGFFLLCIQRGISFCNQAAAALIILAKTDRHGFLQILSDILQSPEDLPCEVITVYHDLCSREISLCQICVRSAHIAGEVLDF